jgi:hypothetical protein
MQTAVSPISIYFQSARRSPEECGIIDEYARKHGVRLTSFDCFSLGGHAAIENRSYLKNTIR